jgi:hypothetical protein
MRDVIEAVEAAWHFTRNAVSQVWKGHGSFAPLATPSQDAGDREKLFPEFLHPSQSNSGSGTIKLTRARIKSWSAQASKGDLASIAALGAVRTVSAIKALENIAMDPALGDRKSGPNPCEAAVHALWQGLRNPVASAALVNIATRSPNKDAKLRASQVPIHPYEAQRAAVQRAVQKAIEASPEEFYGVEVPKIFFSKSL